jgi:uncharacterized protein (TIGR00730 family)
MKRICVFLGSNPGARPEYAAATERLARELVRRNLELVYGGASVGLMRRLADTVLDAGGRVTGIMPQGLVDKEIAHDGLTDRRIVGSMQERKLLMADLSDGFIGLPGGLGTLDEFFEMLTWTQIGLHTKPCGLLDAAGYWRGLLLFLDHAAQEGFIASEHRDMIVTSDDPADLLDRFACYHAPNCDKWFARKKAAG